MSRGRRKSACGRFTRLPATLMEHIAVTSLSHGEFRLLVVLAGLYRGKNNGAIGITAKQRITNGFGNRQRFYRNLKELERRGLIEQTYPASRVPPRPTMYALTWLRSDDTDFSSAGPASYAYREWRPEPPKRTQKPQPKLRVIRS